MSVSIPVAEELIKHRQMMLRLARSLVGHEEAEDVVQDAYTCALARPPEREDNLRGWMLRITRNLALNRRRSLGREAGRDRLPNPAEIAEPSEALDARFEITMRVAEAVRALEEPYRSVLLLRYFEDKAHEEIAAILTRPLATVRTQLRRGLEQLRDKMDRDCGGREAWSAALIAWIDGEPLIPTAPATAFPLAKALWLGTGLVAATAVWLALRPNAKPEIDEPRLAVAPAEFELGPQPDRASFEAHAPAREPLGPSPEIEVGAPGLRDHRILIGLVHDVPSSLGPTRVRVLPVWRSLRVDVEPIVAELDERGAFRVGIDGFFALTHVVAPDPDELEIVIDHPQCVLERVRVPVNAGQVEPNGTLRYDVDVRLRLAAILAGTVHDERGEPVEGARVVAFGASSGAPETGSQTTSATEADGSFSLRATATGSYRIAVLRAGFQPTTMDADLVVHASQRVGTVILQRGQSISGRCLRAGAPIASARVVARPAGRAGRIFSSVWGTKPGGDLVWTGERFEWASMSVESDSDGRFQLSGLASGEHDLVMERIPSARAVLPWTPERMLVSAPAEGVDLELEAALVTLDCNAPAAAGKKGNLRASVSGQEMNVWLDVSRPTQLMVPPRTPLTLLASIEGAGSSRLELFTPEPGEEFHRTLVFSAVEASAGLDLVVLIDPPVAALDLWLAFHPPEVPPERAEFTRHVEVVEGRARVDGLTPGSYRVLAKEGRDPAAPSFYPTCSRMVELRAGAAMPVSLELVLGGQIRVDVRDASGQRRRVLFRLLDSTQAQVIVEFEAFLDGNRTRSPWYVSPWSPSQLAEPVAPGSYELLLWDDDVIERRLPVLVEAGRTATLDVRL